MNKLYIYLIAVLVSQSAFAIDCNNYLNEKIKPLAFYGTILSKKANDKTNTYIFEIKNNNNEIVILELLINKRSTELFKFSLKNSMIKKEKNSIQISLANRLENGSIEVQRFDVSCE